MYPVLFEIGRFKLHAFGLMLVVAFLVSGMLVVRELRRRGITPNHMEGYPLAALAGGIVGARLYYVLGHWSEFLERPFAVLFGGSGLTWYGGLIGGTVATLWLARRHGTSIADLCDAFAPGLAAAYGVGRIGCQLAGDGDYGPPTDLPWGTAYPNGVVPTLEACHPTPVYEVLMMGVVVAVLWALRKRFVIPGRLFALYMLLAGVERWISEIFRVRPERPGGMSVAQWISVGIVLIGVLLWTRARARRDA